jgi:hypothetical protein
MLRNIARNFLDGSAIILQAQVVMIRNEVPKTPCLVFVSQSSLPWKRKGVLGRGHRILDSVVHERVREHGRNFGFGLSVIYHEAWLSPVPLRSSCILYEKLVNNNARAHQNPKAHGHEKRLTARIHTFKKMSLAPGHFQYTHDPRLLFNVPHSHHNLMCKLHDLALPPTQ